MNCADCRFHSTTGQCRKEPPTAMGVPQPTAVGGVEFRLVSFWPTTQDWQWCGEFEEGKTVEEVPTDNAKVIGLIQRAGH